MQTVAVVIILAVTLFFTVRGIVRSLRNPGPHCGCGGCKNCPKTGSQHCHCHEGE